MRKEFGKWLMDIAKYITTAFLITSVFGDIPDRIVVYILSIIAVGVSLFGGLWLLKDKKTDKNINEKEK